eukprot:3990491-Amphidinium_carterae.1
MCGFLAKTTNDPTKIALWVTNSDLVKEPHGMLAPHTTKADLYSRLWWVYEVSSAEAWEVKVQASTSKACKQWTIRRMTQSVTLGFVERDSLAASGLKLNTAAMRQAGR